MVSEYVDPSSDSSLESDESGYSGYVVPESAREKDSMDARLEEKSISSSRSVVFRISLRVVSQKMDSSSQNSSTGAMDDPLVWLGGMESASEL